MKWLKLIFPGFVALALALVGIAWRQRGITKYARKAEQHQQNAERLRSDRHLRAAAAEHQNAIEAAEEASRIKQQSIERIKEAERENPDLADVIDAFNKRLRERAANK